MLSTTLFFSHISLYVVFPSLYLVYKLFFLQRNVGRKMVEAY